MKKRLVSLMLVAAMTMSVVLGGCGNSKKESSIYNALRLIKHSWKQK